MQVEDELMVAASLPLNLLHSLRGAAYGLSAYW
jgi:hypothetical protein